MILVRYIDVELNKSTQKVDKIKKYGIWSKGCVILLDKKKTTVRNWDWIKIVWPIEAIKYFWSCVKINILFKIKINYDTRTPS